MAESDPISFKNSNELSYHDIISLMEKVTKKKFLNNQSNYIKIIKNNMKNLMENNPNELLNYLSKVGNIVEDKIYIYNELLKELKVPVIDLTNFLNLIETTSGNNHKIIKGYVLGNISITNENFLFDKIKSFDENKIKKYGKISLLIAINVLLYRNLRKVLPKSVMDYVISCLDSKERIVSSFALRTSIWQHRNYKTIIKKSLKSFFGESLDNKYILCHEASLYCYLIDDEELILSFYKELYNMVSEFETHTDMQRYCDLLTLHLSTLDKQKETQTALEYQKIAIALLNKLLNKDAECLIERIEFLRYIGSINIKIAYDKMIKTIDRRLTDQKLIILPNLIIEIFRFDKLMIGILKHAKIKNILFFYSTLNILLERIEDQLDTEIQSHKVILNQIDRNVGNKITNLSINDLECKTYDELIPQTEKIFKLIPLVNKIDFNNKNNEINWYNNDSNRRYAIVKDILYLIDNIGNLLFECAKTTPWVNYEESIKEYTKKHLKKLELFNKLFNQIINTESVDKEKVVQNFKAYPLIYKFFTMEWLEDNLKTQTLHPLIIWLNKLNYFSKWPLDNVKNLEFSLSFFSDLKDQGTKTIIKNLKNAKSFFGALVHIQLAKKLSIDYKLVIEEKIKGKPADLFLSNNDFEFIIELTSIDMYAPLKYSNSVVEMPDKVVSALLKKTCETSKIPVISYPIIIAIDVSLAPESDFNGVVSCLEGKKKIKCIVREQNRRKKFNAYEKYDVFTNIPESKNVSALLYFKVSSIRSSDTEFEGAVFRNKRALYKISNRNIEDIKNAIFKKRNTPVKKNDFDFYR